MKTHRRRSRFDQMDSILCIDDQATRSEDLAAVMEKFGVSVSRAESVREVAPMDRNSVQAIFVDCIAAEIDGVRTSRLLREQGWRQPIVLLVDRIEPLHEEEASKWGAVLLEKPVDSDRVFGLLKSLETSTAGS